MAVDRRLMLMVGLLDGVGVVGRVGRAEEEMDEVTRGETEELTGVEAAVGDSKEETYEG